MQIITPFWLRIPQFFLYPLKGTALIMLATCPILLIILPKIPFGLLLSIVVAAVFIKYAYTVLEHTAHGNLQPPPLTSGYWTDDYSILFKQLFIFLLIGAATSGISSQLGSVPGMIFLLLAAFLLPASIMALATTNSLLTAINPSFLFNLVFLIGWPYLILYGFLFLLSIGKETAIYLIGNAQPTPLQIGMMIFVSMYFTYIIYHMMGYVIYQYHDRLGFSTYATTEDATTNESLISHEGMEIVERHIQNENFPAAQEELKYIIRKNPDDIDLRMRFHKLVRLSGDTKQLTYHGQGLITRLLDNNRLAAAVDVFLDCFSTDRDFRPEKASQYLTLAEALQARGKHNEALSLVNGFHKRHPGDPTIPDLYFLAARIFVENLQKDDKARPILTFLNNHYDNHPLAPKIRNYMSVLEQ